MFCFMKTVSVCKVFFGISHLRSHPLTFDTDTTKSFLFHIFISLWKIPFKILNRSILYTTIVNV